MFGYVYKTTCLINNKQYIGRKVSDVFLGNKYLGSGLHLKNAIKSYGKDNFVVELLQEYDSFDELVEGEIYWIAFYDAVNSDCFYNHSPGGYDEGFVPGDANVAKTQRAREINSKAHRGKKMGEEFSRRQAELHTGKPSGMTGKHHSEETKNILREKKRQYNLSLPTEYYKKVGEHKVGNKMMNKDGKCIRVHPQDFEKYLNDGWVFGGLKRNVDKRGEKNPAFGKSYNKGKVWIHHGSERKLVYPDTVQSYIDDGWKLGIK